MYEFKYQRPTTVRQAANLLAKDADAKLLAGGHSLIPVMKLRLAKPPRPHRPRPDRGARHGIELKGRSLVIGAMTRHVEVANSHDREGGAAGARRASPASIGDPAGAPPRHHRRLARQQRSERRLSGGGARPRRHDHHQQAPDRGRRFLQGHVRDRARARRDHHQGAASRSPRRRPTRSSSTRPRASRWSACSCPSAAPTSAWR